MIQYENIKCTLIFAIVLTLFGLGSVTKGQALVNSPVSDYITDEINFYPQEVELGDSVYIALFLQNKTDQEINYGRLDTRWFYGRKSDLSLMTNVTLVYKGQVYDCNLLRNFQTGESYGIECIGGGGTPSLIIPPGQRMFVRSLIAETPPLDDWNIPFWRQIREDVERYGETFITINVEFIIGYLMNPQKRHFLAGQSSFKASCEIKLKKRDPSEMKTLEDWSRMNTSYDFPLLDLNDQPMKITDLEDLWKQNDICFKIDPELDSVDGEDVPKMVTTGSRATEDSVMRIPYYNIMRVDHRKPPAGASPTTPEGWQELEEQFKPGVLRDEIHFANLLLSYLIALESGEDNVNTAKHEIVEWLKSIPETQRYALIDYFYNDPLPSLILFAEIEGELDFPYPRKVDVETTVERRLRSRLPR